MVRNRILLRLILVLITSDPASIFCQELNPEQLKYIEEIVERSAEQEGNAQDITALFNELVVFFSEPININTASREELDRLQLMNDFQIAALLEYRSSKGPLLSVYELLYIPGFREEDIELFESFIVAGAPLKSSADSKLIPKGWDHSILFRYQRIVEKQTGYLPVSDSVLYENPDKTRMLGSPDKLYLRYRLEAGSHLAAGIIAEKDAGEEFFSGSNRQGFDFYAAYLTYKTQKKFLRQVIIGDFHVRTGQGLFLWTGYGMGKTSYINQLSRRSATFAPKQSAEENRFLRGVAFQLGRGRVCLNAFASSRSLDGTLADSSSGTNSFESLRETGIHATPADIKYEKSVIQSTAGIGLHYEGKRLTVGWQGCYTGFNKTFLRSEKLYKSFMFSGNSLIGSSVYYRYLGRRYQLFGEAALSNHVYSFLNGMLFFLNQNIRFGVVHRYYPPSYYACFSNAMGEGSSNNNEQGFFMGGEFRFVSYTLKVYGDVFSFPWLKYAVDVPSEGNDIFMELSRKIADFDVCFRYRRRETGQNLTVPLPDILTGIKGKHQLRCNIRYSLSANLRLQQRIEFIHSTNQEGSKHKGYLVFQDVNMKGRDFPAELSLRAGYFNTTGYDARLFAYEKDVQFAFSNPMLYGKGWRFLAMIKWQPMTCITFWVRISQSFYPGKESIGNGISKIDKNRRTEIKFQSYIRL